MIYLPKPCSVVLDEFSAEKGGRHCASCNKLIPDFTDKTEEQILEHLRQTGQSCGTFRADQVTDGSTYGGWQHYFNWKRAVAVLLLGSVFFVSCHRRTSGMYAPPKRKLKLNLKGQKGKREVQARFFHDNSSAP